MVALLLLFKIVSKASVLQNVIRMSQRLNAQAINRAIIHDTSVLFCFTAAAFLAGGEYTALVEYSFILSDV
jgi:hypothetical protein